MYEVEFSPDAVDDLSLLRKHERKAVLDGINVQLQHEPTVETRNRKRLRPNPVAEWELRLGRYWVSYNVLEDALTVIIEAVGFKIGNLLYIRGVRTDL
jgi:mRNA-degrading endonuclease RelE of RelBE toxin-antitoxin system